MSRQADFTSYEWIHLRETVEFVGLGMLAVSRSGPVGKLRELAALSSCLTIRALPLQFKRNELVLAVLEDAAVHPIGPRAYLPYGDLSGLMVAMAVARRNVLSYCERTAALLAAKSPRSEAEGWKRWLLWIARTVAEASGDRWLGRGRKVSDDEASMLNQIAAALHTSLVAAVPTASELETMLGLLPEDANGVSGGGESRNNLRSSP